MPAGRARLGPPTVRRKIRISICEYLGISDHMMSLPESGTISRLALLQTAGAGALLGAPRTFTVQRSDTEIHPLMNGLYDRHADPGQMHNRFRNNPGVRCRMMEFTRS